MQPRNQGQAPSQSYMQGSAVPPQYAQPSSPAQFASGTPLSGPFSTPYQNQSMQQPGPSAPLGNFYGQTTQSAPVQQPPFSGQQGSGSSAVPMAALGAMGLGGIAAFAASQMGFSNANGSNLPNSPSQALYNPSSPAPQGYPSSSVPSQCVYGSGPNGPTQPQGPGMMSNMPQQGALGGSNSNYPSMGAPYGGTYGAPYGAPPQQNYVAQSYGPAPGQQPQTNGNAGQGNLMTGIGGFVQNHSLLTGVMLGGGAMLLEEVLMENHHHHQHANHHHQHQG
jgi:hypothetical protein